MDLQLIKTDLLAQYLEQIGNLDQKFEALHDAEISTDTFSFYTSVSVMASSKIEGERLEIDSYVKHKMLDIEYLEDLVQKPNDLYNAYLFAQKKELTEKHFLEAHQHIVAHLLAQHKQGNYRQVNMLVMEHTTYKVQYEAALYHDVSRLMKLLWEDIYLLLQKEMNTTTVLYFASFIHMAFVNIHPFEDGNGRAGRLLEKWFIAQKLGEKAWFLQSELNYYKNINHYYQNLNRLGMFYEQLDYTKALPFLLMLPKSLEL